jgi:hypothetical protein
MIASRQDCMASINRVASLCLVSALLSACGGGGGGSSSPPSSTTPPPSSTPPPPFALTEANAVQAAAYALAPLEQILPAGSLALGAAAFLRTYGGMDYTVQCASTPPVPIVITYSDRDASGLMSIGDVINVPAVDCGGVRRQVALTLTQLSPSLDQTAGHAEIDLLIDSPAMHVVGSFDISRIFSSTASASTYRLTNVAITVAHDATTQTIRVASSEITYTPTTNSVMITGGSVDSGFLGGSYTFATTAPLAGTARRFPNAGELMLSAAAGSRARVVPPSTLGNVEEQVEYAVAPTSAGSFGPTQQTMWTAVIRGSLFGWRPNVAPTLTNLSIQPPNPSPGAALYASYFANDANGDPLQTTFEWRRNGTVVGTDQFLSIATARNDKISLSVTVSDGRLTTTASTSITIGNPPPQLNLTLTPPQPNSSVDLVAVPNVYEPDGDPVTLTYEWKRNGSVIPNRTTATLPASETTSGDAISVRVTASDGASTVEATASVTITNAPPRVSLSSLPTTVAHGAPVTFTATVSDPDGDPVDEYDFVLAYGPAGMTVDPTTGVVSWTPSGPMFDRAMNVSFGIAVDSPSVELGIGTIQVTDANRDYPLLRFGTQIPTWPAGLSVGDFDDDNDAEMLVMGNRWLFELEYDGAGGYRQSWAYPFALDADTQYSYNSGKASLATGDVDRDGRHEIFTAVGRTITKLDGVNRRPVATRQLTDQYAACIDLVLGDLENDGAPELLCLSTASSWQMTRILVLRASDLSIRYYDQFPEANYGSTLTLGNVDGDAAMEIVTSGGYVFDGTTLANQWLYTPGFGFDVDTGDLDGDGVEEIVAAVDWTGVRGYSATSKSPLWEAAPAYPYSDLDSLLVADIGGGPEPEILVGNGQWGYLMVYRYNAATGTASIVDQIDSQDHGVTSIGVGNVDGDGGVEIIWGSGASSSGADVFVVAGLHPTLTIEWTNEDPASQSPIQLDGPFLGGELAGSALATRAPLFLSRSTNSGYAGSRLVRMSTNGTLEVGDLIGTYYDVNAFDVVDYDNDTTDEAFLAHSYAYYDGYFRAYDFFTNTSEWSSGTLQSSISAIDVTHADLTGDGRAELVGMTSDGVVYVHNIAAQTLVWQSTSLTEGRKVLVANVDGDAAGELEIVAVTSRGVYVYKRNAGPIPYLQSAVYQTTNNQWIIDADVGDTDGDGDVEIVLLTGTAIYSGGNGVVTLSGNLQPQTIGTFTLPWDAQSVAIEPSPTPRKNLLVGRVSGTYYDGSLAIVGARSGGVVSESPRLIGSLQRDSVHYVTLPGETLQRISIGTSSGMYLTR